MTITFHPAVRENVPLLLGVAGGTGSGKTFSALLLARGLAGGHPFAGIDTENRRMNHYADRFPELHVASIHAPFRPSAYIEAIDAAVAYLKQQNVPDGNRVVVVDSMSHEWAGDGGCLDWADEISGGDPKKTPVAWAKVKPAHKRMVTRLLQIDAHVVVCLRAEERMDIVREDGQIKFVPKRTLPGGSLDGWAPITEKNFPFEMTASFLLMSDAPGVPRVLKLEEDHKAFVPLDRPLTEPVGREFGAWASGGLLVGSAGAVGAAADPTSDLVTELLSLAVSDEAQARMVAAIEKNAGAHASDPAAHVAWLRRQIGTLRKNLEAATA